MQPAPAVVVPHDTPPPAAGAYRTAFLDPDYRKDPKGKPGDFCCRCQKSFKACQPRRWVHLIEDLGVLILHPDDEAKYRAAGPHKHDYGIHAIGFDCARVVGMAFTHREKPEAP